MLIEDIGISKRSKQSIINAGFTTVGSILDNMLVHQNSYLFRKFGVADCALYELREWLLYSQKTYNYSVFAGGHPKPSDEKIKAWKSGEVDSNSDISGKWGGCTLIGVA